MLNEIHVEGFVTGRRWRYSEAEFVRLAVYPDAGRSMKRAEGAGRELPDHITLRCEGLHALAAGGLQEGDRIRAAGMLTSRDYEIPLETFASKARGAAADLESLRTQAQTYGADVAMPHTINEVLVERLTIVERKARGEEPARRRKERGRVTSAQRAAPPAA
jgi:hypothetical protein